VSPFPDEVRFRCIKQFAELSLRRQCEQPSQRKFEDLRCWTDSQDGKLILFKASEMGWREQVSHQERSSFQIQSSDWLSGRSNGIEDGLGIMVMIIRRDPSTHFNRLLQSSPAAANYPFYYSMALLAFKEQYRIKE
jgi:hypothetical protein